MAESPEAIAYAESVRSIEQQARILDELRSRTGLLLAGASIVTSLLGATALDAGELNALSAVALCAFVGVVGCCIWLILPRRNIWRFSLSATILIEDWADEPRSGDVTAMTRFVATTLDNNFEKNQRLLDGLYTWFTAAAVFARRGGRRVGTEARMTERG